MTFLLILIILIASIYIIKSQNIKAAIKKDIEKIIPDNQHNKPQSEQHNNYNRKISRKKPVYEPNQDKQNSQPDINAKDIITEIKTIFLNIVDALKTDYYKLKNSIKEYFKGISVEKDVKHVEKKFIMVRSIISSINIIIIQVNVEVSGKKLRIK